ncbi:MAG: acetyl-coenzyme A synthetase N-terminal domain-containing protein [Candidatus Hodarchaeales archaeon]
MSNGKKILWNPSDSYIKQSNLTQFICKVNDKYNLQIESYQQLYDWSINKIEDFWGTMWEFGEIVSSQKFDRVCDYPTDFFQVNWFPGTRLNFAENLLKHNNEQLAYVFRGETEKTSRITYSELKKQVAKLAISLRQMGVSSGDCIASYIPNLITYLILLKQELQCLQPLVLGPSGHHVAQN